MDPLLMIVWGEVLVLVGLLIWILYPTKQRMKTFKKSYLPYHPAGTCWWCGKNIEVVPNYKPSDFVGGFVLCEDVRFCSRDCGNNMIDAA